MSPRSMILAAMLATGLGASCAPGEVSGTAYYSAPSMEYVGPGVQVVAGYDDPIFYSDSFYWRYYGGGWYRSPYYDRGWVSVGTVPYGVARIDRPWAYAHYHVRGPGYYGPRYQTGYRGVYGPSYRGNVRATYPVRPVPRGMRVPVRPMGGRDHRR